MTSTLAAFRRATTRRRDVPRAPRPALWAGWSKRTLVLYAFSLVLVPAAVGFSSTRWLGTEGADGTLVGVLTGLSIVVAFAAHRTVAPHLGRLTTIAALALLSSAAFAAWTALAPQCPDTTVPGRCTGPEIANWAMIGAILPLTYTFLGMFIFLAVRLGRVARVVARRVWQRFGKAGMPDARGLDEHASVEVSHAQGTGQKKGRRRGRR